MQETIVHMPESKKMQGRKKPYLFREISRVACARCGKPSQHQWQICADDNTYRGLCTECDIELNGMVLQWIGFPDWQEKLQKYIAFVNAN